jgi:hypothetical protein
LEEKSIHEGMKAPNIQHFPPCHRKPRQNRGGPQEVASGKHPTIAQRFAAVAIAVGGVGRELLGTCWVVTQHEKARQTAFWMRFSMEKSEMLGVG